MPSDVEKRDQWDLLEGLTYFVARAHGLAKDVAKDRAMYLFAIGDILEAEDVGRSMGLSETQTIAGLVWNQWIDLESQSTKLQRFFDRTLRDHYSGVSKILDRFGGHLTVEQAKEFRRNLSIAYLERNKERIREFTNPAED